MASGGGRSITVAKVANFSEPSKSRRKAGGRPALSRFKTSFFDKHRNRKGSDVNFIYVFLHKKEGAAGQNTMKNTARRVGAAGVRGLQASPRERRRGGAPSTAGDTLAPRARQKMSHKWRAFGARLQGANLGGLPTRGNPCRRAAAAQGGSRKKTPRSGHRCADRRERPRRGVPSGAAAAPAAGARQGQPPHKGGKAHPTERRKRYAKRRWGLGMLRLQMK